MVHDPRVTQQLSRLGGLYRDPARVDRDAASLLKSSVGSHLSPIAAEMVENNGNTSTVLVLQGTIAIHFRGNTYQLLLDIYLPAGYPQRPPVAYVRLAENMYLKENHRQVGSDGKVYLPYLHNWNPQTHNLVELVVALSSVFSADPPVFSRAPMAPNSVTSTASSSSGQSRVQQEAMLAREAEEANRAAEAARRAEREEQQERIRVEHERARREQEHARQEEQRKAQLSAQRAWEEARTQQVREQVNEKVQRYLNEQSKQTQQQVQSDWRDQQRLNLAAEQKIEAQLELYQQQKRELERLLSLAEQAREDITSWLEEYETNHDTTVKKEVSADDMVQPASQLHNQMLNLSAENAAISDVLYFLDRALYRGNLSLQDHLKQVRKLAKRQFLVRAHLIKINQVLLDQSSSRKLNGGRQYSV